MLALCHSGACPEGILKMFDPERVYFVVFHALYQNGYDIETAVSIDCVRQREVSASRLDDFTLFLSCYRFSRVAFGRRESGFYLNKAECFLMEGNDIYFIPMKPVIALNDLIALLDQIINGNLLTLGSEQVRIVADLHGFSPS